jgi:xanthine dehydrogenase accessory factor
LRSPANGELETHFKIGEHVEAGQLVAEVGGEEILSPLAGIVRGLLHPGRQVTRGLKIGDIDLQDDLRLCQLVSDKALSIGGGVLEALLSRPEARSQLWT